ncbi:MAG: clostripain-related cysteine peptidase [Candidatus Wallbacteria bacterium]|nr:clostripain-related cysteine peptidase [Candidatus Wallbacteria bacterium]
MKNIFTVILVGLFLFSVFSTEAMAQKKWTVMILLNGDNNLDSAGNDDVNEMKKIGSTDQMNLLVLQDHAGNNNTQRHIVNKNEVITEAMGEIDMGDWNEALKFFKWGVDNYPAEHYFYALWNHGAGWEKKAEDLIKGISYDDQSGHHITTPQMRLLSKAMYDYIGRKVDILGYDACLMAMIEVAMESKDYCDYVIFSEETEPGDGWPYDDFLAPLAADPDMSPEQLCKIHVEKYIASYSGGSQGTKTVTQSAVNCNRITPFMSAFNQFTETLISKSALTDTYKSAIAATQDFYYSQYKDLYDFLRRIKTMVTDQDIITKADAVMETLKGSSPLVTANGNNGGGMANAEGLSIYMPSKSQYDGKKAEYRALKFGQESKWADFIEGLYYPKFPVLSVKSVDVIDKDGDGKVSPGESITFKINVSNDGTVAGERVSVKLTTDSFNATVNSASASLASVPGMGLATVDTLTATINASCPSNETVNFVIHIIIDGNDITKTHGVLVRKAFEVKSSVLLLVKDATDEFSKFYTQALSGAGIGFDLWDIAFEGRIGSTMLARYTNGFVVFNAPGTSDIDGINADDMINYLEKGGSLFITGQDVGYKIKGTKFFDNYLHAKYIQDNTGIHSLKGSEDFAGIDLGIAGGDGANNQKWPDEIDAIAPAKLLFSYDAAGKTTADFTIEELSEKADIYKGITSTGGAGVYFDSGVYKVAYFAFGFEAINSASARTQVMSKIKSLLMPRISDKLDILLSLERQLDGCTDAARISVLSNQIDVISENICSLAAEEINAGDAECLNLINATNSQAVSSIRDDLRAKMRGELRRGVTELGVYEKALKLLK